MTNLKKNLLLFFVIISSLQCNRFPSDKDGAPIEPLHVLKKKPKPKLIKLANPPIDNLEFFYDRMWGASHPVNKIKKTPSPPISRVFYNQYYFNYLDPQSFYVFPFSFITVISRFEPKFPMNSIKKIHLKGPATNFIKVFKGYDLNLRIYTYRFKPKKGVTKWYYINIIIDMEPPYQSPLDFWVWWRFMFS